MDNQTNVSMLEKAGNYTMDKAVEATLYFISHPIMLAVAILTILVVLMLMSMFQSRIDSKIGLIVIWAFVFVAVVVALLILLLGVKMGHYDFVNDFAESIFKGTTNITNETR
jgi:hypothetical protein